MTKDFLSDQNPKALFTADGLRPLPDWAVELTMEKQAYDHLDARVCFADPARRLFPVHTKAAAFLSTLYFAGSGGDMTSALGQRLEKAAHAHGVWQDLEFYLDAFKQGIEKSAAEQPAGIQHALVVDNAGRLTGYYPVRDSLETVKAASHILRDRDLGVLPVEWYTKAAAVIVHQAHEQGCLDELPPAVLAAGEPRLLNKQAAASALVSRLRNGDVDSEAWTLYNNLLEAADHADTREEQIKLAEAMHTVDARCSISYNRDVPDPFELFFGKGESLREEHLREKAASTVELNGVLVPLEVMEQHGLRILDHYFGKKASEGKEEQNEAGAEIDTHLERADKIQKLIDSLDPTERNELMQRLVETYQKVKPVTDALPPTPLPV